jgi:hypothetical protein
MQGAIRPAVPADIDAIIALGEQKRIQYEQYQLVFWRKAPDSAEKARAFLPHQMARENVISLVHERDGAVDGFVIAALVPTPPVYATGGPTLSIDDYHVAGADWAVTGAGLLAEAVRLGKERGAVQVVVVCGQLDEPKRAMLAAAGLSVASEWWTKPI